MTHSLFLVTWLIGLMAFSTSCGHSPTRPSQSQPEESQIEISYETRHSHRRFSAREKNNLVTGQTYLDHQIVTEGSIDRDHYHSYIKKVAEFLEKASHAPVENPAPCRSNFTITLFRYEANRIFKGCRDQGTIENTLSRLVKEGEFLLYSKK